MKTRRILWLMLSLLFCFGLIAFAPGVRASERADSVPSQWGPQYNGEIQVKLQRSHWSNTSVNVVVYDQNWNAIADTEMTDGAHTFTGLRRGDYHVAAEADDGEISLAQDIPVLARQTTQVALRLEQPQLPAAAAASSAGSGSRRACRGVAGDGNLLKIYPTFGVTVIYMQCGHVVGKVAPAGCGCSGGNWRYTYDCQKSTTIYVNLPCPRK